MRPTSLTKRLNRLAELVPSDDRRRRLLENIDLIAQEAMDALKTYVNKHGDELAVPAPNHSAALNAMRLGAEILGVGVAVEAAVADAPDKEGAIVAAIRALPKASGER